MHNPGTTQYAARELIREKTAAMEKLAAEFSLWLTYAEEGGGINGRESDKLREKVINVLS